MPAPVSETTLQEWTGYKRRSKLIEWLRRERIPYRLGHKGKICVVDIDLPMTAPRADNQEPDPIEFA